MMDAGLIETEEEQECLHLNVIQFLPGICIGVIREWDDTEEIYYCSDCGREI